MVERTLHDLKDVFNHCLGPILMDFKIFGVLSAYSSRTSIRVKSMDQTLDCSPCKMVSEYPKYDITHSQLYKTNSGLKFGPTFIAQIWAT